MINVMFVCHGNICRSTMAEMVFKDMVRKRHLDSQFFITSSATSREEIGNGVHYGTRHKLAQVGIPCENHRAVQLTKKDYEKYDYILGMDEWNRRNMHRIVGSDSDKKVHLLLDFSKNPKDFSRILSWNNGMQDDMRAPVSLLHVERAFCIIKK